MAGRVKTQRGKTHAAASAPKAEPKKPAEPEVPVEPEPIKAEPVEPGPVTAAETAAPSMIPVPLDSPSSDERAPRWRDMQRRDGEGPPEVSRNDEREQEVEPVTETPKAVSDQTGNRERRRPRRDRGHSGGSWHSKGSEKGKGGTPKGKGKSKGKSKKGKAKGKKGGKSDDGGSVPSSRAATAPAALGSGQGRNREEGRTPGWYQASSGVWSYWTGADWWTPHNQDEMPEFLGAEDYQRTEEQVPEPSPPRRRARGDRTQKPPEPEGPPPSRRVPDPPTRRAPDPPKVFKMPKAKDTQRREGRRSDRDDPENAGRGRRRREMDVDRDRDRDRRSARSQERPPVTLEPRDDNPRRGERVRRTKSEPQEDARVKQEQRERAPRRARERREEQGDPPRERGGEDRDRRRPEDKRSRDEGRREPPPKKPRATGDGGGAAGGGGGPPGDDGGDDDSQYSYTYETLEEESEEDEHRTRDSLVTSRSSTRGAPSGRARPRRGDGSGGARTPSAAASTVKTEELKEMLTNASKRQATSDRSKPSPTT